MIYNKDFTVEKNSDSPEIVLDCGQLWIETETGCCLDGNENKLCDADENKSVLIDGYKKEVLMVEEQIKSMKESYEQSPELEQEIDFLKKSIEYTKQNIAKLEKEIS